MAEFATLQHATYTEAEWTAWDGVLLEGQIAYSSDVLYVGTDQMRHKVGNGTDTWTALDYVPEPSGFTGGSLTSAINEAKGSDIASAATTDIGAATGNFVHVTGTTTITALGTVQAGTRRTVRFAGALTLTHNATSLILPTGANITTATNDVATFVSEGSGNWRCVGYMKADGTALSGGTTGISTALFKTNANYAHTGTTNETVLYSTSDLNGSFAINDIFRILLNYNCTSNGNNKTVKIYLASASQTQGSTFSATGTTQLATMLLTTNAAMKRGLLRNIQFMGSLSSQQVVATTTNGLDNDETALSSNATLTTMTWDYSTTTHLIVTGTLASAGDTINFLHFRGQIIR